MSNLQCPKCGGVFIAGFDMRVCLCNLDLRNLEKPRTEGQRVLLQRSDSAVRGGRIAERQAGVPKRR
jgi:hypothetical protein